MPNASNERAMDRNLEVRTPESIEFSYELAGLGSRFLAVFIDLLVQIGILVALVIGLTYAAARIPTGHAVHSTPAEARLAESIVIALLVFVVFMIFFGYFILFETFWNGQTPGKKLLGIRVVRDGGYPVDFGGALVRNVIRIVEAGLGFYAIAAICALASPENKRFGDMAAGTIVVREGRSGAPATLQAAMARADRGSGAYLTADERNLINGFLTRRESLEPGRRRTLAAALAERVRTRAPADLQRLDDESLLERI
jgi:uncharacterized RDD family membrane protein YckC